MTKHQTYLLASGILILMLCFVLPCVGLRFATGQGATFMAMSARRGRAYGSMYRMAEALRQYVNAYGDVPVARIPREALQKLEPFWTSAPETGTKIEYYEAWERVIYANQSLKDLATSDTPYVMLWSELEPCIMALGAPVQSLIVIDCDLNVQTVEYEFTFSGLQSLRTKSDWIERAFPHSMGGGHENPEPAPPTAGGAE